MAQMQRQSIDFEGLEHVDMAMDGGGDILAGQQAQGFSILRNERLRMVRGWRLRLVVLRAGNSRGLVGVVAERLQGRESSGRIEVRG